MGRFRFQSRNRVWAGSRRRRDRFRLAGRQVSISQSSLGRFTRRRSPRRRRRGRVSISQSSLGRFTLVAAIRVEQRDTVSISQSSLGRFTQPIPLQPDSDLSCFNLAIEFGPVHA